MHLGGCLGRDNETPSHRLGLDSLLARVAMAIMMVTSSVAQLLFPIQHICNLNQTRLATLRSF